MQRTWVWVGAWTAAIILMAAVILWGPLLFVVLGMGGCDYELADQQLSPDGRYRAGVVDVNCGATTGFVRWVILTKAKKPFNYKRDLIAAIESRDVGIIWDGPMLKVLMPESEDPIIHRLEPMVRYERQ